MKALLYLIQGEAGNQQVIMARTEFEAQGKGMSNIEVLTLRMLDPAKSPWYDDILISPLRSNLVLQIPNLLALLSLHRTTPNHHTAPPPSQTCTPKRKNTLT
jgi:hypothetical protein